jgi:uncharacterized Zn finger protein (UPF0148 family)
MNIKKQPGCKNKHCGEVNDSGTLVCGTCAHISEGYIKEADKVAADHKKKIEADLMSTSDMGSTCPRCFTVLGRSSLNAGYCLTCSANTKEAIETAVAAKLQKKPDANDGSNNGTSHYNLPKGATEVKHLIWHKNMNAQVGEIFRAAYRLGTASHSSRERDLKKIIAYAEQELERMGMYEAESEEEDNTVREPNN